MSLYCRLLHSKWSCSYYLVFILKLRQSVIYGSIQRELSKVFQELARQKDCWIVEGHLMPEHVHMCIEIPPKYSVASVMWFIKGKSAIVIARQHRGKVRDSTGDHFWAMGYAVSMVGFEMEAVKKYILE